MKYSRIAIASLTAFAILLVLAVSCATAKPKIASGSNCSSSWVNNAGAMACFIQGEEEANAGASHPHYVACAGGDIFCCQDNDRGAQNCVAQASTRPPSKAVWTRAVLAAQRTHLKIAEGPAVKGGSLKTSRKNKSAR
jgi:hypothetical protein